MKLLVNTTDKTITIEQGQEVNIAELEDAVGAITGGEIGWTILTENVPQQTWPITYPYVPSYPTWPQAPIEPYYYTTGADNVTKEK